MANYVSQHTGTEIDTAVNYALNDHDTIIAQPWKALIKPIEDTIAAQPWKVLIKPIETNQWAEHSDSGHSARYMYEVSIDYGDNSYNSGEDVPMVWFMDSTGGRYYTDYAVTSTGNVRVYSNSQIAGRICILGLVHAADVN